MPGPSARRRNFVGIQDAADRSVRLKKPTAVIGGVLERRAGAASVRGRVTAGWRLLAVAARPA